MFPRAVDDKMITLWFNDRVNRAFIFEIFVLLSDRDLEGLCGLVEKPSYEFAKRLSASFAAADSDNRTIVDDFSFAESFPLLAKPPFLYCQGPVGKCDSTFFS